MMKKKKSHSRRMKQQSHSRRKKKESHSRRKKKKSHSRQGMKHRWIVRQRVMNHLERFYAGRSTNIPAVDDRRRNRDAGTTVDGQKRRKWKEMKEKKERKENRNRDGRSFFP